MDEFPRFDLNGQVALVTAAARGLGRAIALALARAGADVALGLRVASSGSGLVREIEAMGRRALALQMDMTDLGQIFRSVDEAAAHLCGSVDGWRYAGWRRAVGVATWGRKAMERWRCGASM